MRGGSISRPGRPIDPTCEPDGTVDLAGSLTRELDRGDGLHEAEYIVSDEWIIVHRWPTVAMMRMVTLNVPAEEGAADEGADCRADPT